MEMAKIAKGWIRRRTLKIMRLTPMQAITPKYRYGTGPLYQKAGATTNASNNNKTMPLFIIRRDKAL